MSTPLGVREAKALRRRLHVARKIAPAIVFFSLAGLPETYAREMWVDNLDTSCCTGSSCPGTPAEPFCTISAAVAEARPPDCPDPDPICLDRINVCPETYAEDVSFGSRKIELIASTEDATCTQSQGTVTVQGEIEIKPFPSDAQGPETIVQGFGIEAGPNGIEIRNGASPRIIGNTIMGATGFGGIYVVGDGTDAEITGNTITDITDNLTAGVHIEGGARPTLAGNTISDNAGSGVRIEHSSPTLRGNTISGNGASGVLITGTLSPPMIVADCLIEDNDAPPSESFGGGIQAGISTTTGTIQVVNSMIRGNSALSAGGGIYVKGAAAAAGSGEACDNTINLFLEMQNCIVTCNDADRGGGVFVAEQAKGDVVNSTFALNTATAGTSLAAQGGCANVYNSLLWDAVDLLIPEIHLETTTHATITHTIVEGACAGIDPPPTGTLDCDSQSVQDVDPLFVGEPFPEIADCFVNQPFVCPLEPEQVRVRGGSPAIDCGDNTRVLQDFADLNGNSDLDERTPFDFWGNDRFHDDPAKAECPFAVADPPEYPEVVDIGVFEYPCTSPPTNPVVVVPDFRCQDDTGDPCVSGCTQGVACGPLFNNRFLTMVGDGPQPTAMRVLPLTLYDETICGARQPGTHPDVSPFECDPYFVGEPVEHVEDAVPAQPNWIAAATACSPHARDWTGDGLFQSFAGGNGIPGDPIDPTVFHLFSGEIMPCSTYAVQAMAGDCAAFAEEEFVYGAPSVFVTEKFGDVWPELHPAPAEPSFTDIGQVTNKFKSFPPPDTPIEAQAQLARNVPRPYAKVDFIDIGAAVDGFKSFPYREHGPCPCPTEVVCGTLECDHCAGNGDPCDTSEDCPVGDECVTCSEGTCSKDEHNMGELRCRDECKRCVPGS